MTLDDFRALSLEELNAWLTQHNDELVKLHRQIDAHLYALSLAYRVLKEKMLRPRVS